MDYSNKIKGCMLGGAVGDALGYSVEFMSENEIFSRYGSSGITSYDCDFKKDTALISDDTQMSLFTAEGIIQREKCGKKGSISAFAAEAYLDWYGTQSGEKRIGSTSRLADIPDLNACRAPGMTCLSALRSGKKGSVEDPINMSKGCGGIMRVAPIGLLAPNAEYDINRLAMEGAEAAAVTHGHPLGYIPAAVLVYIVNKAVYGSCADLEEAAAEAVENVSKIFIDKKENAHFKYDKYVNQLKQLTDKAICLSKNNADDIENIHKLGEGWVAEETLAIALYCCLRYSDDFSKCVTAAVNHNGDSDSTGAAAGNILGAWLGFDAIDEKWKKNIELYDVIMQTAEDLCRCGA